jgi:hypothetical protein
MALAAEIREQISLAQKNDVERALKLKKKKQQDIMTINQESAQLEIIK